MIQPGAKNWISKYFSLVEDGTIKFEKFQQPNDLSKEEYLHNILFRSGIVFGYPIEPLFFDDIEVT
ncbi:MAG TPA: hypothetical protein VFQ86_09950, partial [Arachidicoccus soli]|nr:hypothetical protein [Arachidicoccus soli]